MSHPLRTLALAAALSLSALAGIATPAQAVIVLAGDSNLTLGAKAGNFRFFENVLQGGTSVVVLNEGFAATGINNVYDNLAGVSSTLAGTITAGDLASADLLVVSVPDNDFSAGELAAIGGFVSGGGSVFFLGEYSAFSAQNGRINNTLAALGSSLSIMPNTSFDGFFMPSTGAQIVADPLTAGVDAAGGLWHTATSEIAGGTALSYGYLANTDDSVWIAYENISAVPEPAALSLFGLALAGLGFAASRRPIR